MNLPKKFIIDKKLIGDGAPLFFIAEIGLAHEGSLGMAYAFIDAVAKAGADAVKFQTHLANQEGTVKEDFRVKIFPQDNTRQDYWSRTSFSEPQWSDLKNYAETKGLVFLSSPFSVKAVEMLRRIGVKAWKVGSGETNNPFLLESIASGAEPVFLSTGMSYIDEIDRAVKFFQDKNIPVLLMQCTNKYPCPPEYLGLDLMSFYKNRFNTNVGFSDHSGEVSAGIAATALGAKAIEVHVTWSKSCFGPDVKASLTLDELAILIKSIRFIEKSINTPVDKDAVTNEMREMRCLFTKGLVINRNLPKGTIIKRDFLDAKKPCLGIPVAEYNLVLDKVLVRDVMVDEPLFWADLS